MDDSEITERQREHMHAKLLDHFVRKQMAAKRGLHCPGMEIDDNELALLLRMTRARAAISS